MEGSRRYNNLLFDVSERGIALVTVNRPEVCNAMNDEAWKELKDAIGFVKDAREIHALIVTGMGEKAFVAGADISGLAGKTLRESFYDSNFAREAVWTLEHMSKPTIAAVNGYAFGGGCELALACDIRIVADGAKFALPETGIGVIPALGGTQRLARCVGIGLAKDMILTGRIVNADEALQWGLATYRIGKEGLLVKAYEVAEEIIAKSPMAIALAKRAVNYALDVSLDAGMNTETLAFSVAVATEDKAEGIAAFLDKRPPAFSGC